MTVINNIKPLFVFTDKLYINKPAFIHLLPDFNSTGIDVLDVINLEFAKCHAMIIKTSIFKLANSILQPRKYYNMAKNRKNLPCNILQNLPNRLVENKYFIIDHTVAVQAVEHLKQTIGEKQAAIYLIQNLKKDFRELKTKYPSYENLVIFSISSNDGMLTLIENFPLITKVESLNFFDNFSLAAVSAGSDATTFVPILSYSAKGEVDILKSNIPKIKKALELATPTNIEIVDDKQSIDPSSSIEEPDKLGELTANTTDTIKDSIKKDLESEMYKVNSEIDSAKLSKVLRTFKIQDENVANNIKLVVNEYLDRNKDNEIKKTDLENVVLKAIHYSLFGTDEVSDIYKTNPNQLISKLEENESFAVHLTYPEPTRNITLASPRDINQLKKVTGPVRHKFEFNQNIHENIKLLFKSLEQKPNFPIKIQKFNYEYYDDNLNRFIEYTITLKNISGGKSEPYDVKVRIPALVNDKYFKLNGQNYILASQQFLHPLTKDKPNEARLLSHYGMVRLRTVNLKFNLSQIQEIVNYIKLKYPILIDNFETNIDGKIIKIKFIDPESTELNFIGTSIFKNNTKEIIIEDGDYFIIDLVKGTKEKINDQSEFISEKLLKLIQDINPNDHLKKSKKSIPYLELFIMSKRMPFILWMAQQIGLINALTRFNIKYEIAKQATLGVPDVNLVLDNGDYLYIYGESKRQELIVNGLLILPKELSLTKDKVNDNHFFDEYINSKYGTRTIENLNLATANFIDPVTESLLKYQDLPTNLVDILSGPLTDKLLNDAVDLPNDLNSLRSRQAEQMAQILYKELMMGHNKYANDIKYGIEESSLYLDPNYVSDNLIGKHIHSTEDGGSALAFVNPHNPVDEITQSCKIVKTGVGGIPNKRSFNKFHRGIHPTYIGNIGPHESTEYANVGLINFHTLGAVISNRYGFYGNIYIDPESDHMNSLGIGEALVPLKVAAI